MTKQQQQAHLRNVRNLWKVTGEALAKAEKEGKRMQKIKFKGKRIDNGEEVKGYYCKASDRHLIIQDSAQLINPCGGLVFDPSPDYYIRGYVEVDPETVGQFVCLDKNGDEVFAGDGVIWDENYTGKVVYLPDLCCWSVKLDIEGEPSERIITDNIELIKS